MTTDTLTPATMDANHTPSMATLYPGRQDNLPANQDPGHHPGHANQAIEDPSYTLPEAATLTGKSTRTLRRLIKAGRLAAAMETGDHGPEYRVTAAALATLDTGPLESPTIPLTTGKGKATLDTRPEANHPAGAAAVDLAEHYERLLREKDARIKDLAGQLEERNRGESELRRLLATTTNELQELRHNLALSPPGQEQGPEQEQEGPAPAAAREEKDPGELDTAPIGGATAAPGGAAAPARPWWKFWS